MTSYEELRARHLADVRAAAGEHQHRLGWTRAEIDAAQTQRLRGLLRHAAERSAFYRERLAGVDLAEVTARDLPSISPVTKGELMERWDDVVTDPALHRADL
jgi:phenylacetate-coenzyme A ligase PaaK-like adenylate-forming protein